MPSARFKFKLPGDSPIALSTDYPDGEFRIQAAFPIEDGLLVVFEARIPDNSAVIHYFDESPFSYDVLHTDEQTVLVQYVLPFVPSALRAVLASGNLVRFPLTLHNEWMIADLTTSHERLSQLKAEFEDAGLTYEILSVTQSTEPTDLLTDRQHRLMTEAIQRGYYDSPRRCSLTDLAAALDVGKSTASRVLHNAEETVIKEFFAEPIE